MAQPLDSAVVSEAKTKTVRIASYNSSTREWKYRDEKVPHNLTTVVSKTDDKRKPVITLNVTKPQTILKVNQFLFYVAVVHEYAQGALPPLEDSPAVEKDLVDRCEDAMTGLIHPTRNWCNSPSCDIKDARACQMICDLCKVYRYCSQECLERDKKDHQEECKRLACPQEGEAKADKRLHQIFNLLPSVREDILELAEERNCKKFYLDLYTEHVDMLIDEGLCATDALVGALTWDSIKELKKVEGQWDLKTDLDKKLDQCFVNEKGVIILISSPVRENFRHNILVFLGG
jgi:hypothetical protein